MASERLGPPYGPVTNLKIIFTAGRDRGFPRVVDRDWFERIGLSGNLTTRNIHALRFLRLVDDDHRPTELAERLRIAPAPAFAATLAPIVRTSYAKVWAGADPAVDSRTALDDAFRHELPTAQRARMVACFIGLCELAGIRSSTSGARTPPTAPHRRRALPAEAVASTASASLPSQEIGRLLLAKFPDFDPAWPDGVKEKWFEAFGQLRRELTR